MKIILLATFIVLVACSPSESISSQMRDHDEYLKTEGEVLEALNGPQGPNYAAAVRIIERSDRVALQKDYDIGNLVLKACSEKRSYCAVPHDAREGVMRLVRVARTPGEDQEIAAGDLAAYLRSGAGPSLPPDPAAAACWEQFRAGKVKATTCPSEVAAR